MMKERATALKEQEIRLGAMLASLQMEKAKEVNIFIHPGVILIITAFVNCC